MNAFVIAHITLESRHQPTGRTKHSMGGVGMRRPVALRIVKDGSTPGFYLEYCDADGMPVTDTWHATLDDAFDQAEFEFTITRAEWRLERK